MRACNTLGQQGGGCRLYCNNLHRRVLFLQIFAYACDCAACADACNENIYLAIGICPDFGACGFIMRRRIGRVHKLSCNEGIGDFLCQLLRLFHCTLHAQLALCQHQLRTKGRHQQSAFHAHAVRHNDDCTIASCRRHQCQTNACVAACGLNDGCALLQDACLFRILHHALCDTILRTAAGVQRFYLCQQSCARFLFNLCQLQ